MSNSGVLRRSALLLAAALLAAPGPALAQTPQTGGRRGPEMRVPLRPQAEAESARPRIPVVMVSPDEVTLPVAREGFVPSWGGGMTRPPQPGAPTERSGDSLFDQLVAPGDATAVSPLPSMSADDSAAAEGAPMRDTRLEPSPDGQGRPPVRVIAGGAGRIRVVPADEPYSTHAGVGDDANPYRGGPVAEPATWQASTTEPVPTVPGEGTYRIGAGDVLDVFVWRNEELSRRVPVRPDGLISLPLVGEIEAAGMTAEQLQARLAGALAEFIQQPTVTVSLIEIRSLVVYVLGNVNTPGTVVMERNLTVLQAIAMAGGLNEFADRNDIVVLRTDASGAQRRFTFRYDDVVKGRDLSSNLLLQAGDVIHVP